MKETILLMKKSCLTKDNRKFDAYYAYRTELNANNERVKKLVPTKEGTMRLVSMKVNFVEGALDMLKKQIADNNLGFPVYMTLDSELLINGNDSYFITIDKDINRKPRLDKKGKKHLVLVVRAWEKLEEAPTISYTFDDLEEDL